MIDYNSYLVYHIIYRHTIYILVNYDKLILIVTYIKYVHLLYNILLFMYKQYIYRLLYILFILHNIICIKYI